MRPTDARGRFYSRRTQQMQGRIGRIRAVLARASRDRWLSGGEVMDMACDVAALLRPEAGWHSNSQLANRAVSQAARVVGMVRGRPVLTPGDPRYIDMLRLLRTRRRDDGAQAELEILGILIGNTQRRKDMLTEIADVRRIRRILVEAIDLVCHGKIEVGRAMAVFAGAKAYSDTIHAEMLLQRNSQPSVTEALSILGPDAQPCTCAPDARQEIRQ